MRILNDDGSIRFTETVCQDEGVAAGDAGGNVALDYSPGKW